MGTLTRPAPADLGDQIQLLAGEPLGQRAAVDGEISEHRERAQRAHRCAFASVEARSMMPGDSYYAFCGVEEGR